MSASINWLCPVNTYIVIFADYSEQQMTDWATDWKALSKTDELLYVRLEGSQRQRVEGKSFQIRALAAAAAAAAAAVPSSLHRRCWL